MTVGSAWWMICAHEKIATEMAGLADGNYVYDVQVDIISTGYRHTYISGNLIALPDATR